MPAKRPAAPAAASVLVLFDIDGTLVRRAGPEHVAALVEAVREVTGLETRVDGIPLHGMLDTTILRQMMEQAGATPARIRKTMPAIVEAAERIYVERGGPRLERRVCPKLARKGVPLGLVTGNLSAIGWEKLTRAGLARHFLFGAFAQMAPTRSGLVRTAMLEAQRRGLADEHTAIVLVGDSPSDVLAARENCIRCVAVCTGISTREELAGHDPYLLLNDLRELRMKMLE
jgi:phosphoglycolate phosphatase